MGSNRSAQRIIDQVWTELGQRGIHTGIRIGTEDTGGGCEALVVTYPRGVVAIHNGDAQLPAGGAQDVAVAHTAAQWAGDVEGYEAILSSGQPGAVAEYIAKAMVAGLAPREFRITFWTGDERIVEARTAREAALTVWSADHLTSHITDPIFTGPALLVVLNEIYEEVARIVPVVPTDEENAADDAQGADDGAFYATIPGTRIDFAEMATRKSAAYVAGFRRGYVPEHTATPCQCEAQGCSHADQAVPAGSKRAAFVGAVCDTCAATCVADYLI